MEFPAVLAVVVCTAGPVTVSRWHKPDERTNNCIWHHDVSKPRQVGTLKEMTVLLTVSFKPRRVRPSIHAGCSLICGPRQPHHLLDSGSLRCLKQTSCCRKMAALLSGRGNKLVRLDVDLHDQRGPHLNFMGIAKAHCASCAFTSRCAIDVRQLPGTASKTEASMRSF